MENGPRDFEGHGGSRGRSLSSEGGAEVAGGEAGRAEPV